MELIKYLGWKHESVLAVFNKAKTSAIAQWPHDEELVLCKNKRDMANGNLRAGTRGFKLVKTTVIVQ